MVKLALYFKANLQGVTNLRPATDDFEWFFKVKCTSCQTEHPKMVAVNATDKNELRTGHDTANFVWKCSECKKESSASFDNFSDTKKWLKPYQLATESAQQFQPLAVLDCRGLEFLEFDLRGKWICVGAESGTAFDEVEFEEGEWTDYDEKAKASVEINEIETKFDRIK